MVRDVRLRALLLATLLLVLVAPARAADDDGEERPAPGATFDQIPELLPGGLPPASYLPRGSLEQAVAWFRQDEFTKARRELEAYLDGPDAAGNDKLRANFLLGYLYMQRGDYQLASLHFYRVRKSHHPLALYAAYFEAYVDYARGKYRASIPECEEYRERYPEGPHFEDCELLIADSHREAGRATTAIKLYKAYIARKDDEAVTEQIQLSIARAYEVAGNTRYAARMYTNLAISHHYASNGQQAEAGLERLIQAGGEAPELTDHERWVYAHTLKGDYRWGEAYDVFLGLMEEYKDQPESAFYKKLESNEYSFRYHTRQYLPLARESAAQFEETQGTGSASEYLQRTITNYNKGGDFVQAARYAEIARTEYKNSGRFRGIEQDLAWYYTNAQDYENALVAWKRCYNGRKGSSFYRWMVAYATYRAGDYDAAIEALTPLVDGGGEHAQAARFYRAKCHIAQDRLGSARADFNKVISEEPQGWYAQVIESRRRRARRVEMPHGIARDGRWPGGEQPAEGTIPPVPERERTVQQVLDALAAGPHPREPFPDLADGQPAWRTVDGVPHWTPPPGAGDDADAAGPASGGRADWAALTWPYEGLEQPPEVSAVTPASPHVRFPTGQVGIAYDEARAMERFAKFVDAYEEIWPLLPVTYELKALGFDEQALVLVTEIYDEVDAVQGSRAKRKRVEEYEAEKAAREEKAAEAEAQRAEEDPDHGPSAEKAEVEQYTMSPPLREEERWLRMMDIRTTGTAWRDLFILVGNPHYMLRNSVGTWRLAAMGSMQDPEANAGWRQNHPLAYGEMVWELCEVLDLDPMLIFALMRQESTYHPTIVSPAGAIGVMQIMPGTGSKVAALSGYFPYHPDGLTDPATNIYFGIWYLSRLNARYDGQFPLAVGSYNGGPHNIGRWLRSKQGIGLEEFVEEIPFNETRGYVKKVVRNYAMYLAIYDPEAYVQLPRTTRADDPTVINF